MLTLIYVVIPEHLLLLVEKEFYLLQLQTGAQDATEFLFLLNTVKLADEHFLATQIASLYTKMENKYKICNTTTIDLLTSVLYVCTYSFGVVSPLL